MADAKGFIVNPNDHTQKVLVGSSADICFFDDGSTVKDKQDNYLKQNVIYTGLVQNTNSNWVTVPTLVDANNYRLILIDYYNSGGALIKSVTIPKDNYIERTPQAPIVASPNIDSSDALYVAYASANQISIYNSTGNCYLNVYGY